MLQKPDPFVSAGQVFINPSPPDLPTGSSLLHDLLGKQKKAIGKISLSQIAGLMSQSEKLFGQSSLTTQGSLSRSHKAQPELLSLRPAYTTCPARSDALLEDTFLERFFPRARRGCAAIFR